MFPPAIIEIALPFLIFAPRRLRLHQQVARALERRYAGDVDAHAAQLAEHFSFSTDAEDLSKAVTYGERAARRAMDVYAFGEAARLAEQTTDDLLGLHA